MHKILNVYYITIIFFPVRYIAYIYFKMGDETSELLSASSAKVILESFNNAIINSVFDTIQGCYGINENTRSMFQNGQFLWKLSKYELEQELYTLQNCAMGGNFKERLNMVLYDTISRQIHLINQSHQINIEKYFNSSEITEIYPIIHYDLNRLKPEKLALLIRNIRGVVASQPGNNLSDEFIMEISNDVKKGLEVFINEIPVVKKINQELEKRGGISSVESFIAGGPFYSNIIYYLILIVLVAFVGYKISVELYKT